MSHECHWPSCRRSVPPSMWGCRPHWFRLPKAIRDRIWATYVPGQEITKTPSDDYLEAAMEATRFALKADSADDARAAQKEGKE